MCPLAPTIPDQPPLTTLFILALTKAILETSILMFLYPFKVLQSASYHIILFPNTMNNLSDARLKGHVYGCLVILLHALATCTLQVSFIEPL